jgi:gamma-glutamylcyclotransferase (GGCT)/AIG2-like uncharacterized protein YtfP
MKKVLYFAYGSNIDIQRLRDRVGRFGNVIALGPHRLNGFRLVFNCGGFANIEPHAGSSVEGILYDLNDEQLHELDWYEGFYYRQHFDLPNGRLGLAYVGKPEVVRGRQVLSNINYVNLILDACKAVGFKDTYNRVLQFKTANFSLKRGSKHKPWL